MFGRQLDTPESTVYPWGHDSYLDSGWIIGFMRTSYIHEREPSFCTRYTTSFRPDAKPSEFTFAADRITQRIFGILPDRLFKKVNPWYDDRELTIDFEFPNAHRLERDMQDFGVALVNILGQSNFITVGYQRGLTKVIKNFDARTVVPRARLPWANIHSIKSGFTGPR